MKKSAKKTKLVSVKSPIKGTKTNSFVKREFRKILITGGAGYVGSALTDLLLREGFQVRVLDSLKFGGLSLVPFFSDMNFEFQKGDVRVKSDVDRAMAGVDAVIHLAAIVGFPACRKDPAYSREVNVEGTKNVVAASGGKIPVFYASTGSNYGKMLEKICYETTPLNPLTDYGRQKTEAEKVIQKNTKEFVIYRFATAFGVSPRLRLDLLPNDFTYRAVKEKNLIVYEKHFMRTFIHVRDMAQSFLFALQNYPKMKGEVFNVGSNDMNHSKEEICNMIREQVDYYLHFAEVGHDLDQRDYIVSYDKIQALGFRTNVPMRQGITELVKVAQIIDIPKPYHNA
jgi:nucleoside-diphosphate-sugar epimerase